MEKWKNIGELLRAIKKVARETKTLTTAELEAKVQEIDTALSEQGKKHK